MQPEPREHHQHTAATGTARAADAALYSVEQKKGHDTAAAGGENAAASAGGGEDGRYDHSHDDIVADAINAAAAETYSMATADLSSPNIPHEGEGPGARTATSAPLAVAGAVPRTNAGQDATHPHTGNELSPGTDTKPPPISMQELAMNHLYPSLTKDSNTEATAAAASTTNEQSSISSTRVPLLASASVPVPPPAGVLDSGKNGNTANSTVTTNDSNKKDESQNVATTASSSSSSKRSGESSTAFSSEMKKKKRARRVGKVPDVSNPYHTLFVHQRDSSSVNKAVGERALSSAAAQAQAAVATGMLYARGSSTMELSFSNNNNSSNKNADSPYNPNSPQMPPPQIDSQQDQKDDHVMSSSTAPILQGGDDNVDFNNRPDPIQYAEGYADHDAAVAAAVEAATSEIAAIEPSSTAGAMIGNDALTNESTTTENNDFNISTAAMIEQDHKSPIASDDAFATTIPANDIAEIQYVSNPIGGGSGSGGGINNHPFHHLPPSLGAGPSHPPDPITERGRVGPGADVAGAGNDEGPVSLSNHDKKWNAFFEKLLEFKRRNNQTVVPQIFKDDPALGRWVHYQRVEYWALMAEGKGKITPQRIARLNSIGFEWNPKKARWDHMFQRLLQFRAENGHCRVPKGYKQDKELANWVRNQRQERANMLRGKKKERMPEERFLRLDAIGFKWSTPQPRLSKPRPAGGSSTDTSNGSNAEPRKSNNPLMEQQHASEGETLDHDNPQSITTGKEIPPAVPEPERTNPSLPSAGDSNNEDGTPGRKLAHEV